MKLLKGLEEAFLAGFYDFVFRMGFSQDKRRKRAVLLAVCGCQGMVLCCIAVFTAVGACVISPDIAGGQTSAAFSGGLGFDGLQLLAEGFFHNRGGNAAGTEDAIGGIVMGIPAGLQAEMVFFGGFCHACQKSFFVRFGNCP